jgi:iron(III) transport system ATP-binding protein
MTRVAHHPPTLFSVIVAVAFAGCDGASSQTPELDVTQVNNWSMPAEGPKIPAPRGLAFDSNGDLFVLDDAGRVLVFDRSGTLRRKWFMPQYEVGKPEGICLFHDGRVAVSDTHYHRIVFFDREGRVLSMHGEYGTGPGQFIYTSAMTQDPDGNYYVCEYGGSDRVQKFDVAGRWLGEFGGFGTEEGQFQRPMGIVWNDALLYVADAINNRIQVFRDDGTFDRVLRSEARQPRLHYPYDLASGPDDDLFAIEYGGNRVTQLDLLGNMRGSFGSIGHGVGEFSTPWGIAVSVDGRIVVADTGNRRLVELQR